MGHLVEVLSLHCDGVGLVTWHPQLHELDDLEAGLVVDDVHPDQAVLMPIRNKTPSHMEAHVEVNVDEVGDRHRP